VQKRKEKGGGKRGEKEEKKEKGEKRKGRFMCSAFAMKSPIHTRYSLVIIQALETIKGI